MTMPRLTKQLEQLHMSLVFRSAMQSQEASAGRTEGIKEMFSEFGLDEPVLSNAVEIGDAIKKLAPIFSIDPSCIDSSWLAIDPAGNLSIDDEPILATCNAIMAMVREKTGETLLDELLVPVSFHAELSSSSSDLITLTPARLTALMNHKTRNEYSAPKNNGFSQIAKIMKMFVEPIIYMTADDSWLREEAREEILVAIMNLVASCPETGMRLFYTALQEAMISELDAFLYCKVLLGFVQSAVLRRDWERDDLQPLFVARKFLEQFEKTMPVFSKIHGVVEWNNAGKCWKILESCHLEPQDVRAPNLERALRTLANALDFENIKWILTTYGKSLNININATDAKVNRRTALHWAVIATQKALNPESKQTGLNIIEYFLNCDGIDSAIPDGHGKNPIDYADSDPEILEIFRALTSRMSMGS